MIVWLLPFAAKSSLLRLIPLILLEEEEVFHRLVL